MRILILLLVALPVFAADTKNEALQAALQICQQQVQTANTRELETVANLTVQMNALRARIKELEDAAKPKDGK